LHWPWSQPPSQRWKDQSTPPAARYHPVAAPCDVVAPPEQARPFFSSSAWHCSAARPAGAPRTPHSAPLTPGWCALPHLSPPPPVPLHPSAASTLRGRPHQRSRGRALRRRCEGRPATARAAAGRRKRSRARLSREEGAALARRALRRAHRRIQRWSRCFSRLRAPATRSQPRSGWPTILKLTCWVCRTNPSTLGRKRARAHQIGEPE
ncbi:hypothetical protein T484DRAFT_2714363, partial [Baffinella frigidus]